MNLSSFDAESAKDLSLVVLGSAFFIGLLVLKFAKSIVTKMILLIVCGLIGWTFFNQRDNLNGCIESARDKAATGQLDEIECQFFGRSLNISGIGTSLK